MFFPVPRGTFLIPSGPADNPGQLHLHIFLTSPHPGPNGRILLVNVTTLRPHLHYDPACILQPGDHTSISAPSYVYYAKARLEPVDALRRGHDNGTIHWKGMMDNDPFARVCEGLLASPFTKPKLRKFYLECNQ